MADDELLDAEADVAACRRAQARAEVLQGQLAAEQATCQTLRRRLDDERDDVRRAKGRSLRSVMARVRGSRDDVLRAERAEVAAAEAELAAHVAAMQRLSARFTEARDDGLRRTEAEANLAAAIARREREIAASGDERAARADEVWPVVSFLTHMPDLDADAYRELAGIADGRAAFGVALGTPRERLEVCARCHGAPGAASPIGIVPQLSGQSRAYFERALHDYADGRRPSGYMQLIAAMLDDAERRELAAAYADAAAPPHAPAQAAPAELLRRGEAIARDGLPAKGVPACMACHVDARNPAFPQVLGLSAPYIEQQLRLFREGKRNATTYGPIMRAVALRLDDSDMAAVAAWLAAMPPRPAP
jgi:cytochrome c553